MAPKITDKSKKAAEELKEYYVFYPDFPKKGINFWDVFALLGNRKALELMTLMLEEYAKVMQDQVDIIVGLEARGFLFGPLLANLMKCPFVPIRKKGKLPGALHQETYTLEYGEDIVEIQQNSIKPGQRVVVVDDCVATGGTMCAARNIIEKSQGTVVDFLVFYIIPDIKNRDSSISVTCLCDST